MSDSYTIVYMGTPDFAVPSLMTLAQTRHRVLLVVTQPDRPKGRGWKVCCPRWRSTPLPAWLTSANT